jgi:uncharacterized protein YjiS (DUF1127 family)
MKAALASQPLNVAVASPVLGVVKTTYPRLPPNRPAANESDFSGAAELDIWARRTFAANGFGDAVLAPADGVPADFHGASPAGATGGRGASLWAICTAVGQAVGEAVARAAARWRAQRELRRTYDALSQLDERTLKDIGLGGHEAGSIAAEIAGRAERTRIRALRALGELTI